MSISVELRHRFPSVQMDIAFELPSPGVTALFGPSGAGKSTVVSAAAGLLRPDRCRIVVGGRVFADTREGIWLPPERRRAGLVFQDSRLFPHMSVATNLRFGMRRAPAPRTVRFDDVVELLGIAPLLGRRPHTLSGGERQRVAIGRALLAQPQLLRRAFSNQAPRVLLVGSSTGGPQALMTLVTDIAAGYFRLIELDRELAIAHERGWRAYHAIKGFIYGDRCRREALLAQQLLGHLPGKPERVVQAEDLLGGDPRGAALAGPVDQLAKRLRRQL